MGSCGAKAFAKPPIGNKPRARQTALASGVIGDTVQCVASLAGQAMRWQLGRSSVVTRNLPRCTSKLSKAKHLSGI